MSKKIFIKEDQMYLSMNKYVIRISEKAITYADEFKQLFVTVKGGITVWPLVLTIRNYATIFQFDGLLTGFRNSVIRTVLGTGIGVLSASMVAYVLSKTEFQSRRLFSIIFAMTLYFSGGLIPGYMLIRDLHLIGSFWV